jgi:hypothetical protein
VHQARDIRALMGQFTPPLVPLSRIGAPARDQRAVVHQLAASAGRVGSVDQPVRPIGHDTPVPPMPQ